MDRQVELQIMPKLYLGPGLSRRVHQVLTRRLEQFMAANVAAPAVPAAPAAEGEFPVSENPALTAQAGTAETESEKEGEQDTAHMHGEDKEDKEERDAGRDDDRSRFPRLRMQEPFDHNEATDLLTSTTGLAVWITSMFAALKGSTDKLETLIKSTHTLQQDLCRSLEAVGAAVNNMARASESLAAAQHQPRGCGRWGIQQVEEAPGVAMDVSMGEVLKKNAKSRTERDQALQDVMTQLFESMDKLQENMQKIAVRIEKAPVSQEGTMDYDPPQPPMEHLGMSQGSPPAAPMTPAPGVNLGSGHLPPPPAVPPMVPPRPMMSSPPSLPVAKFVGYSPAKMGELPMSYPLPLEVKDVKTPPCQVLDESTGRIRCVSPTGRHDPATGTAAFVPLGYVQIKGTSEYRRVYPWGGCQRHLNSSVVTTRE